MNKREVQTGGRLALLVMACFVVGATVESVKETLGICIAFGLLWLGLGGIEN